MSEFGLHYTNKRLVTHFKWNDTPTSFMYFMYLMFLNDNIRVQLATSNWYVSEITSRTFARYLDNDDVTYRANVT